MTTKANRTTYSIPTTDFVGTTGIEPLLGLSLPVDPGSEGDQTHADAPRKDWGNLWDDSSIPENIDAWNMSSR